jgi:hypothetical protein
MTYGPILSLTGTPWPVVAPTVAVCVCVSFVMSYLQSDLCGMSDTTVKVEAILSAAGDLSHAVPLAPPHAPCCPLDLSSGIPTPIRLSLCPV